MSDATLLAVGRTFPLATLGLEPESLPHDGRLRVADGVYLVGDPAGPELHTHQAQSRGELAVRKALGDEVALDYRALPRATHRDPELAFVGLTLEQAAAQGRDAFELSSVEAALGPAPRVRAVLPRRGVA